MKILHIHNYHVGRGGLEVIYESTTQLLREHGHEVIELSRDSASLQSPFQKLGALGSGIYSFSSRKQARELIKAHQPDLAYFHNLYPMLSTSVLDACHEAGVPVVMDVQDYKLACPMGQHLRNGSICTKCLDGSVIWSAVHACKGGRAKSAAYALSHGITRRRRAYERGVDLFVVPTQFAGDHLVRAGYDRARIMITLNMCDLAETPPSAGTGEYAAFVGRLSPEKGLGTLVDAARLTGIPVRIAGEGIRPAQPIPDNVKFVGPLSRAALPEFFGNARFLVVPSIWYEVFGLVVIEAMYHGIPVIASNIGGLPEVVEAQHTGLLVPPGDPRALADAMALLWADADLCRRMGRAGREVAVRKYNPDAYYSRLMAAFERAMGERAAAVASQATAAQSEAMP